jgi:transposase InsO family protein
MTDRGTHLSNTFLHAVLHHLSIRHFLSTAYHPQTDGQTERTNRTLEAMLRHYISPLQHDWHMHLPDVQFAINSSHNSSTGSTPFFLVFGQASFNLRFGFVAAGKNSDLPAAFALHQSWHQAATRARRCLQAASDRMYK